MDKSLFLQLGYLKRIRKWLHNRGETDPKATDQTASAQINKARKPTHYKFDPYAQAIAIRRLDEEIRKSYPV